MAPIWSVAQTGDCNGDARSDILWTNGSGDVVAWLMNGATVLSLANYGRVAPTSSIQSMNAD
jgi:hypothetical protein